MYAFNTGLIASWTSATNSGNENDLMHTDIEKWLNKETSKVVDIISILNQTTKGIYDHTDLESESP